MCSASVALDLKNYYLTVAFSGKPLLQPQCSFYNKFTDGITTLQFVYEKQIDLKRAFIAHLEDNPEDKIFFKFACHYDEDVLCIRLRMHMDMLLLK